MRPYLVLILIAVSMAFSAGYLTLSLRERSSDVVSAISTIAGIQDEFVRSHRPQTQLNLDRAWLRSQLRYFTTPEKKRKPAQGITALLELKTVRHLLHRPEMVMGEHIYLFHLPAPARPGSQQDRGSSRRERYAVYDPRDWDQFIESRPYLAAPFHPADSCVLRRDDICWRKNAGYLNRMAQKPAALLMFGSVALTLLAVRLLFKKIEFQSRAEERKRFALQNLTHELRTPLSSIVVSLEALRSHFNSLPEEAQDATMHICDDVQRLQRLAEASKQYLSSHNGKELILFRPRQIPSIHAYLENQLEPYLDRIRLELPEDDQAITLDPYWVGICIKNLVENALIHGKAPVAVRASVQGRSLLLSVQDQGICTFSTLIKMSKPFVKGRSSQGLGLGLAIVRKVIHEMNGSLDFSPNPTCFTLRLDERAAQT